ncbi:MAG TPA: hypothetical protein VEJ67_16435 [Candidatus Cybelea sp.]|nr:hypothetical protein [Candidatus Cybelea sp.]
MKHCDYCHASIIEGQRWVRQKIYEPNVGDRIRTYRYYHASPFAGQAESCWEKDQIEREMAQSAA